MERAARDNTERNRLVVRRTDDAMTDLDGQERKYKMKKVVSDVDGWPAEYELLGNNGVRLWRIYHYGDVSCGTSRGMTEIQAWGLRQQKMPMGRWVKFADGFSTRKEAIAAILKVES